MNPQTVIALFSALTVTANVILVLLIALVLTVSTKRLGWLARLVGLMNQFGMVGALLVAAVAMVGSLIFSEVLGFEPCKLCWFQRIFMYPLVPILALAIGKKDRAVADYVVVLAGVGAVIAAYHTLLQTNPGLPSTCSVGGAVSCTSNFFTSFGYVTIPVMSLSAFLLILMLMLAVALGVGERSAIEKIWDKLREKKA